MSEPSKGEGKPEDKDKKKAEGGKPAPPPVKPVTVGVNPERLKKEFPDLTEEDLAAYVAITQKLLGDPQKRVQVLEDVKAKAQAAQQKGAGASPEEAQAARYVAALQKMQQKRPPAPPAKKE